MMSFRERIIATFEGRPVDKVVWQPRIEKWYEVNSKLGTIPEKYRGMSYLRLCEELGISPRRYRFQETIRKIEGEDVEIKMLEDERNIYIKYLTPHGKLTETRRKTVSGTSYYITEHPVKSKEDVKVMKYILDQERFMFDHSLFKRLDSEVGDRTLPQIILPHTPLLRVILDLMGLERAIKMLWRERAVVEELIGAVEENDAKLESVVKESPFKLVNFGDNIHHDLCPPPFFERYVLPNYKRRTREMHAKGKFCISHWDGYIKDLLPYIKETGLDGLECVTPKPQGDVTLEEIKEAMDDLVLMDGIPAILFLPWSSEEELRSFARRVIEMFSPRLILGIGDLLPPNGDIEKIRVVGEVVEEYANT